MERSTNTVKSLYEHLEQSGVLQSGDEQFIQLERRKYLNAYKAQWRRNKRKEQKECTISFTKKELKQITGILSAYNYSLPQFVKMVILQYLQQSYVPIKSETINHIRALLTQNYALLQAIEETNDNIAQSNLIQRFALLEKTLLQELHHPRTLINAVQEAINRDAQVSEKLYQLLQNNDAGT